MATSIYRSGLTSSFQIVLEMLFTIKVFLLLTLLSFLPSLLSCSPCQILENFVFAIVQPTEQRLHLFLTYARDMIKKMQKTALQHLFFRMVRIFAL